MVGDDGEGVTGGDEGVSTVDHVAVTVTIGGGTKGDVVLIDDLDEGVGVGQVRVGVTAVEVGAGHAVLNSTFEAEFILEDGLAVRTSDTVQAVEENLEVGVASEELLDHIEVEDVLEHSSVVCGAVDDLNLEAANGLCSDGGEVDIGDGGDLVGGESLGGFEDLVGDGFGSGTTIGQVILHAKVGLRTYATVRFEFGW